MTGHTQDHSAIEVTVLSACLAKKNCTSFRNFTISYNVMWVLQTCTWTCTTALRTTPLCSRKYNLINNACTLPAGPIHISPVVRVRSYKLNLRDRQVREITQIDRPWPSLCSTGDMNPTEDDAAGYIRMSSVRAEGTETDFEFGPMTVSAAYGVQTVKEYEVPVGQCSAYGIESQHSSGESCLACKKMILK